MNRMTMRMTTMITVTVMTAMTTIFTTTQQQKQQQMRTMTSSEPQPKIVTTATSTTAIASTSHSNTRCSLLQNVNKGVNSKNGRSPDQVVALEGWPCLAQDNGLRNHFVWTTPCTSSGGQFEQLIVDRSVWLGIEKVGKAKRLDGESDRDRSSTSLHLTPAPCPCQGQDARPSRAIPGVNGWLAEVF